VNSPISIAQSSTQSNNDQTARRKVSGSPPLKQSLPIAPSSNTTSTTNSIQGISEPPAVVLNPVQSVSTASTSQSAPSDSNSQLSFKSSNVRTL
jgi:hypothetical protein